MRYGVVDSAFGNRSDPDGVATDICFDRTRRSFFGCSRHGHVRWLVALGLTQRMVISRIADIEELQI